MTPTQEFIENIRSFNRFYTNVIGLLDQHFLDTPFSLTEGRVLYEIRHMEECSAKKIRKNITIDEGYLSRIIDKFIQQGLITKTPSPKDRRLQLIALTKKGQEEFSKMNENSNRLIAQITDKLSDQEIEELVGMMGRIQELLTDQTAAGMNATIRQPKSGMDVLIRRAAIDESTAIASVLRQAFIEYKSSYTPAAFAATSPTASQIKQRWKEGPVWVALQNGDIVGTVAAVPKRSGFYLRSMAVLPAARGQGIAVQLLKEVERFAIEHPYKRLFLSTTPFLHDAIRLYEECGFVRTREAPYKLHGTPLFTMEKRLRSKAK